MKRLRRRKRRKQKLKMDPAKRQEEIVQNEYNWLDQQNMRGGPSSPSAIPFDKRISVFPDDTIAWVRRNCKFASKCR